MTFNPSSSIAPFLTPSTYFPEDFEEFRVKFLEIYRNIANTTNVREISIYDLNEFLTGQQWYTAGNPQIKRQTFRKAFNLGAVAAGTKLNTLHGLTGFTAFTAIYGTCVTDVVDYRPIPYASATAVDEQIEINVDATTLVISNGAAAPNITSAIVVLEYLKN